MENVVEVRATKESQTSGISALSPSVDRSRRRFTYKGRVPEQEPGEVRIEAKRLAESFEACKEKTSTFAEPKRLRDLSLV